MAKLLNVKDLTLKTQEGRSLVDRVSFTVAQREIFALVGESGSGKTLTSLALMGLLPPGVQKSGGHITFQGEVLDNVKTKALRGTRIATIF